MKVAFAGTPEFAAAALEAILAAGFDVPLVLTQPDRPAGRGMQLQPSPVKRVALAAGIPVHQPEKLRTPEQQAPLAAVQADVLVVAAYGIILPQAVLDLPRHGCLNIHASLLPRWRGAAPIHRAIQAGDAETGITIMQMDAGLDTGPMLLSHAEAIHPDDTTGSLHDRLAQLGAEMIVEALRALPGGLTATPQPADGVTYAAKIGKAEANVDWSRPAAEIERAIRAFNPFPGAVATLQQTPVKLWRARAIDASGTPGEVLLAEGAGVIVACGEGALCITELQKPGGKRLPAADFLRGMPIAAGSRFD
ncbi:MAG: methionyl-tRNA formyltransferase [Zoogloea sp.]|uniref:methionyl-tRNA formyltransferase n=1 Tax=Zoogloea sp. TaxID=49181 RepID=UPI002617494C|nr:methionyl-tRNA formyltransferase [Zoogloea sp.]MDD3327404.1 methionyl-tRNA formyltransferase [Zoogloea sp.]